MGADCWVISDTRLRRLPRELSPGPIAISVRACRGRAWLRWVERPVRESLRLGENPIYCGRRYESVEVGLRPTSQQRDRDEQSTVESYTSEGNPVPLRVIFIAEKHQLAEEYHLRVFELEHGRENSRSTGWRARRPERHSLYTASCNCMALLINRLLHKDLIGPGWIHTERSRT